MLQIQEHIPLGSKTTMRIGGFARFYAELRTKDEALEAERFAMENGIPLIVLGSGSNTIFADEQIGALVVRILAKNVIIEKDRISAEAGCSLATLVMECAERDLDLSALTGIPGTVGGALFGNAGQGPNGTWIDTFVESVTALTDLSWRTFNRAECCYRYRESMFKNIAGLPSIKNPKILTPIVLWKAVLRVPVRPQAEIEKNIEELLKKRIETQPHLKTAGSCFKALPDGTPAWKLIDASGLRGHRRGDLEISEKHANFLLNTGRGTFADALAIVGDIRESIDTIAGIEMRFYGSDGRLAFS